MSPRASTRFSPGRTAFPCGPGVTSWDSATFGARGEHRRTAEVQPSDPAAAAPATTLAAPVHRGDGAGRPDRRGAGPGGDEDDPLPGRPPRGAEDGEADRQAVQARLAELRR